MTQLSDWLALAGICMLGAMSPGPSLAVVIRHSVDGGRGHGVAVALSHGVGVGLYAGMSALGIAALLTAQPMLLTVLQFAGALFLLWLAFSAARQACKNPGSQSPEAPVSRGLAWRDGFLIAFLNPKIAVFFLALFSQFVEAGQGWLSKLGMAALASGIDALWYALVALVLSTAPARRAFFAWRRYLDGAFACLLALVACRVLYGLWMP
jgi:threonine/homoserine/homoserine lactone efflux protein